MKNIYVNNIKTKRKKKKRKTSLKKEEKIKKSEKYRYLTHPTRQPLIFHATMHHLFCKKRSQ